MESRIQRIFLTASLVCALSLPSYAQEDTGENSNDETILDAVINPDIKRRRIDEDKIDTEDFEAGIFAGVMSVEDFGSNSVYGFRLAYHISEDWFIEGTFGVTETSETSFEVLGGGAQLLTDDQRQLTYYNASLGFNLLPGEVFIGKKYAFNTNYYIIAGVGNTQFADNEYFTTNFGGGFRLFFTDWVAAHVDVRNHLFSHNLFGEDKSVQNLETHMGITIFY